MLDEYHSSALQPFQETLPISLASLISFQNMQLYLEEKQNTMYTVVSIEVTFPPLTHPRDTIYNRSNQEKKIKMTTVGYGSY